MAKEIERKFRIRDESWQAEAEPPKAFRQFYLAVGPERSIRVRIVGDSAAWLTAKFGRTPVRDEFEYPIPLADACEMENFAVGAVILKQRHIVSHGGYHYEVDVFSGALQGLVLAELETPDTVPDDRLPRWLGAEITGDSRYSNAMLALNGRPDAT
ncbi:CYTH domain-containing protein [Mesorhizobium sp. LHD-90]|uniref:CYTH domain-containing protein n=1 Tax=Mesorhizobium sp. LHD-90 TaxID=3071414 RepID=UPI0027DEE906|nr:CYTH domain-containing protein [Mesorhizobium sp. LHD-90]MDQ6436236.1 CYTH domain-containing protein [Mesorhizobium sp. LHD-90]